MRSRMRHWRMSASSDLSDMQQMACKSDSMLLAYLLHAASFAVHLLPAASL
jgi:hypothetical protein